jgi:hypothetical protein
MILYGEFLKKHDSHEQFAHKSMFLKNNVKKCAKIVSWQNFVSFVPVLLFRAGIKSLKSSAATCVSSASVIRFAVKTGLGFDFLKEHNVHEDRFFESKNSCVIAVRFAMPCRASDDKSMFDTEISVLHSRRNNILRDLKADIRFIQDKEDSTLIEMEQ